MEIDTDLVRTKIEKNKDGSFRVDKEQQFVHPEERFMVRFTKSFYDYMLAESPPDEREHRPSERYYAAIAVMLQQTSFFYHKMHDERFIIQKVKQWHQLAIGVK